MTRLQKQIFYYLFAGGNIYATRNNGYRLRTADNSVVLKFNRRCYRRISGYLRRVKELQILNKQEVLRLHGNSWLKREYKRCRGSATVPILKGLPGKPRACRKTENQLELF